MSNMLASLADLHVFYIYNDVSIKLKMFSSVIYNHNVYMQLWQFKVRGGVLAFHEALSVKRRGSV